MPVVAGAREFGVALVVVGTATAVAQASGDWWNLPDGCPEGATLEGSAPPLGHSVWCENAAGQRHGPFADWFPSNQQRTRGRYVAGERDGTWTFWFETGAKMSEGEFRDGQLEGVWTYWDASDGGRMIARKVFDRGKLLRTHSMKPEKKPARRAQARGAQVYGGAFGIAILGLPQELTDLSDPLSSQSVLPFGFSADLYAGVALTPTLAVLGELTLGSQTLATVKRCYITCGDSTDVGSIITGLAVARLDLDDRVSARVGLGIGRVGVSLNATGAEGVSSWGAAGMVGLELSGLRWRGNDVTFQFLVNGMRLRSSLGFSVGGLAGIGMRR